MTTDFRALCVELVDALHNAIRVIHHEDGTLHISTAEPVLDRARAALAEPEPEGLTDEEIMKLLPDDLHKEFANWSRIYAEQTNINPGLFRVVLNTHAVDFARAVLDRWGTPNSAETGSSLGDGEVADLATAEIVRQLRTKAATEKVNRCHYSATLLTRAADLLERLSADHFVGPPKMVEPIPVSERLPEAGDCDAEGRCWLLTVEDDYPQWRLHSIEGAQPGGAMIWVPVDSSPGVMVDCFYTSHWLPAHALPLPSKEVDGGEA